MSIKYVKISDLPVKRIINNDDLFVYSMEDIESINGTVKYYDSKKITYEGFYKSFKSDFESLSVFYPKGKWNFECEDTTQDSSSKSYKNAMFIPLNEINTISSVVTYEYANENYINLLMELSAKLYGTKPSIKQRLPSYVGQIVISRNLASETALRELYGEATIWKLIPGRMLLGAGPNIENSYNGFGTCSNGKVSMTVGRDGGEVKVKLSQIPKHSHKFSGVNFKKFPEKTFSFDVHVITPPVECVQAVTSPKIAHRTAHHFITHGGAGKGNYLMQLLPSVYLGGKEETKNFSFTAHGTIEENKSTENGHRNLPPYTAEYIWERML